MTNENSYMYKLLKIHEQIGIIFEELIFHIEFGINIQENLFDRNLFNFMSNIFYNWLYNILKIFYNQQQKGNILMKTFEYLSNRQNLSNRKY